MQQRACGHHLCRGMLGGAVMLWSLALAWGQPPPARQEAPLELTLQDTVLLAVRANRTIKIAHLDRISQRFALQVAEDKFRPQGSITLTTSRETQGSEGVRSTVVSGDISPQATLLLPTGAQVALSGVTGGASRSTTVDASGGSTGTVPTTAAGVVASQGQNLAARQQRALAAGGVPQTEGTSFAHAVELSVTQPLLRNAGIAVNTASVQTARLVDQRNLLVLKSIFIDTITDVILAYRRLQQAQQQLEISRLSLTRARDLLEVNKTLIRLGRLAKLEIAQAETDVTSRELDVVTAQGNVDAARLALISLLDIAVHTPLVAVAPLHIEPVTLDPDQLQALALTQRPDYLSSLLFLDIAALDVLVARNNRLWDLSLQGTYSLNGINKHFDGAFRDFTARPRDNWSVGLVLTVPLRDLSRQQAVVNTRVAADQAQVRVEKVRHQVSVDVQNGVRNVLVSLQQVELARRARALSETQLEVEREKLQAGRSSNFQLIALQNTLATAQARELDAVLAALNAQTLLDQTLGTTMATWHITLSTP